MYVLKDDYFNDIGIAGISINEIMEVIEAIETLLQRLETLLEQMHGNDVMIRTSRYVYTYRDGIRIDRNVLPGGAMLHVGAGPGLRIVKVRNLAGAKKFSRG